MILAAPNTIVTLTREECVRCGRVGVDQVVDNIFCGRRPRYGEKMEGRWDRIMEGNGSELAVAKHFGVRWDAPLNIGNCRADDVARLEVRCTRYRNGRLIIHPDDKDDRPFILVIGEMPRYELKGWVMGRDAKQKKYWGELSPGRPAFNFPQSDLRPLDELPPKWWIDFRPQNLSDKSYR